MVIAAVVRIRAETKALARQVVISSALASPSEDEIRLANQAGFVEASKPQSPALIFRSMKTSSSSGISTRGPTAFSQYTATSVVAFRCCSTEHSVVRLASRLSASEGGVTTLGSQLTFGRDCLGGQVYRRAGAAKYNFFDDFLARKASTRGRRLTDQGATIGLAHWRNFTSRSAFIVNMLIRRNADAG